MLLLGSYPAKIDEKHRLKIPAKFRHCLRENEDNLFFVTSDDGHRVQIFPMSKWEQIAHKLQQPPQMHPSKLKFRKFTSYYGIETSMDPQGRILIPPVLRQDAKIQGEVMVIGNTDHLEVWNNEVIRTEIQDNPMTDLDRKKLSNMGL